MIAYIALAFSVLNILMWIAVGITIRKVFRKMFPMMNLLTSPSIYDTMPIVEQGGELNKPSGKPTG